MDTKTLRIWLQEKQIERQTFDNFYQCLKIYKHETPDEFEQYFKEYEIEKLEVFLESIDLRITNLSEVIDDRVISTIRIRYDGKYVGQYKLVLDLNGEIIDDVLVID